jgi:SAM-dependent methyltransferase
MLRRAPWQYLPGTTRGLWDYVGNESIASEYDSFFARTPLFEFDQMVLQKYLDPGQPPGKIVVDLGCGTGRALLPLARRGFRGLAVDLSAHMLGIVNEKARAENLPIASLRMHLVEMDGLADDSVDYAVCLFSTLGMIQGRENRQHTLTHVRRILKPSGVFVLHVHNVWYNLKDWAGRNYLLKSACQACFKKDVEFGDKVFPYRGLGEMFLHVFSRRQLLKSLRKSGFELVEVIPLDTDRYRRLAAPWLLSGTRANGWIVVCRA